MACIRKYRGSWVVDWRDPTTKKRCIEGVEENTRDAAKRRLAEILKTDERGASKRLSFQDYATWWLKNCAEGNIKESTYEEYERSLRLHLYPKFGKKPLAAIKRKMVRELITEKRKARLSQSTIRNILAPMRGMYNQALEDEDVFQNPAERMGKFNKKENDKPPINPLTREETQILLDKAVTDFAHYYPLFLCAPRSGMRQGELIALKGTDLDFNGSFIDVQRTLSRGKITLPKSGKTRRVDMSKQLAAVLGELLSKRRAAALRKEMEKPAAERKETAVVINEVMEDWLFITPPGTQLDPSNIRKLFKHLLTAAKLRRVRFHDLRHTFATLLIEQGESLVYVKDQLGHSSIKITVDTYGHLVPGGNRQAVDRLDQRINISEKTEVTA